jgi:hypothetical protein
VPLGLAEAASARLGWPLHVIDDAGHVPHIERRDALLAVLCDAATPSSHGQGLLDGYQLPRGRAKETL